MKPIALALIALGMALGSGPAWGLAPQDPPAPPPAEAPPEAPVRLEAWPAIVDDKALEKEVARLRGARTEEMGVDARVQLIEIGAAAGPELLKALGKERNADAQARVTDALTEITGAAHTRLLAKEFEHKSGLVRCFALGRVASFPDAGVRELADKALKRAQAEAEEKKPDLGPDELYLASLCASSAGSTAGIAGLRDSTGKRWGDRGAEIRTALEAVRGPEATALLLEDLRSGDRKLQQGAMRLLAGCGTEECVADVKALLDSSDNTLRVAAINCLRGIVDGEKPVDKLPVFEAIERAKSWQKRLR